MARFPRAPDGVRSQDGHQVQLGGTVVGQNGGHVVVLQLPVAAGQRRLAREVGRDGDGPREAERRAARAKGQVEGARRQLAVAPQEVRHGAVGPGGGEALALDARGRLEGPVLPDIERHPGFRVCQARHSSLAPCPARTKWAGGGPRDSPALRTVRYAIGTEIAHMVHKIRGRNGGCGGGGGGKDGSEELHLGGGKTDTS